ncbi:hypothetical protein BDF14DRAFT_1834743 [Spinellus fusiger]|nr:hypothetical protein BDF14DRAFT_1834743 [Spinellus fusiger]
MFSRVPKTGGLLSQEEDWYHPLSRSLEEDTMSIDSLESYTQSLHISTETVQCGKINSMDSPEGKAFAKRDLSEYYPDSSDEDQLDKMMSNVDLYGASGANTIKNDMANSSTVHYSKEEDDLLPTYKAAVEEALNHEIGMSSKDTPSKERKSLSPTTVSYGLSVNWTGQENTTDLHGGNHHSHGHHPADCKSAF